MNFQTFYTILHTYICLSTAMLDITAVISNFHINYSMKPVATYNVFWPDTCSYHDDCYFNIFGLHLPQQQSTNNRSLGLYMNTGDPHNDDS